MMALIIICSLQKTQGQTNESLIKMRVLTTNEHLLTGVVEVIDCHHEPIYSYLEDQAVTYIQFTESSKGMPPFVLDDLVFVGVGMDNPLAFLAGLDHN